MSRKSKIILSSVIILFLIIITAILFTIKYIQKSKDYINAFSTLDSSVSQQSIAYYKNLEVNTITENIQASESAFSDKEANAVNILFLGIDRTEDRDASMGVYRTDSIMFISINFESKKVDILSIPRDSYVYIPVIDKKDKINHAYVWGGMKDSGIKSTIDTVNNFIKYKKVDYYFAIDSEPVRNIVDELGGVELDVEIDMHNEFVDLTKGYQLLDGSKALGYILFRDTGNGDIDRVKRQQNFLKAVYKKIKKEGNIVKCLKLFLGYNKYMQTDLNYNQMLSLAYFFSQLSEDNLTFYETPGYGEYIDGISYWIPDEQITDIFKN